MAWAIVVLAMLTSIDTLDIVAWAIVVLALLASIGALVWLLYEGHYIVVVLILIPTMVLWALRRLDPPSGP